MSYFLLFNLPNWSLVYSTIAFFFILKRFDSRWKCGSFFEVRRSIEFKNFVFFPWRRSWLLFIAIKSIQNKRISFGDFFTREYSIFLPIWLILWELQVFGYLPLILQMLNWKGLIRLSIIMTVLLWISCYFGFEEGVIEDAISRRTAIYRFLFFHLIISFRIILQGLIGNIKLLLYFCLNLMINCNRYKENIYFEIKSKRRFKRLMSISQSILWF